MDHVSTLLTAAAAFLAAITGLVSAVITAMVTLRRKDSDSATIAAVIADAIAKHDAQEAHKHIDPGEEDPT